MTRTKTNQELQEIADSFNESERFGARLGLFPASKVSEDLSTEDIVRLMEFCGAAR